MLLNKIRHIFCVPKFVSATNVVRPGKRGNICVGNNVSTTMCPSLPGSQSRIVDVFSLVNLPEKEFLLWKVHRSQVSCSCFRDRLFVLFLFFSLLYSRLAVESPTANHSNYSNWTQTDRCLSDEKATFILLIKMSDNCKPFHCWQLLILLNYFDAIFCQRPTWWLSISFKVINLDFWTYFTGLYNHGRSGQNDILHVKLWIYQLA